MRTIITLTLVDGLWRAACVEQSVVDVIRPQESLSLIVAQCDLASQIAKIDVEVRIIFENAKR